MDYDETKACSEIVTDLEALTGLSPEQQAICDNAIASAETYPGGQVMRAVVNDQGWFIAPPVE